MKPMLEYNLYNAMESLEVKYILITWLTVKSVQQPNKSVVHMWTIPVQTRECKINGQRTYGSGV